MSAKIGYALSSEEFSPLELVRHAQSAESAGFSFALISDHFHPWVNTQEHSPFVWSVIGGIAQATDKLQLGTGVTCPIIRTHPAIIAQAAATAAAMMPGRFFLGVGTGENLNEHIFGDRWPPHDIRLEMLMEAIDVIRLLWSGETISYWGDHYAVEDAKIFTLPEELPAIMMAAGGEQSSEAAGRATDGLIATSPDANLVRTFAAAGGENKPRYGQLTVCWAESEKSARETAYKVWPNAGLTGELSQELRTVAHFEQAVRLVSEEEAVENIVCGPDIARHQKAIQEYIDAGFDHVYIHQIGQDQGGFFKFYEKEILPAFV